MPLQNEPEQLFPGIAKALLLAGCLLFVAMGIYKWVNISLGLSALLSLVCLFLLWSRSASPALPPSLLLPFVLAGYLLFFPGFMFSEAKTAGLVAGWYLTGLAVACFWRRQAYIFALCVLVPIILALGVWLFAHPQSFLFGGRLQLWFNHPNVLASLVIWSVFFLIIDRRFIPRKACLPVIVCCLVALGATPLTGGRSAAIGTVLALITTGFLLFPRFPLRILLLTLVMCCAAYLVLPGAEQQRVRSAIVAPLEDGNLLSRLPMWEAAMAGIAEKPWTGHSDKAYKYYQEKYLAAHKADFSVRYPGLTPEYVGHPHNTYLWVLFSWGGIGAALLLAVLAVGLYYARAAGEMLVPASVAFMLGFGLFDVSLMNKDGLMILFFPLGLAYGRRLLAALSGTEIRFAATTRNAVI